jgi:hypothetical protein
MPQSPPPSNLSSRSGSGGRSSEAEWGGDARRAIRMSGHPTWGCAARLGHHRASRAQRMEVAAASTDGGGSGGVVCGGRGYGVEGPKVATRGG